LKQLDEKANDLAGEKKQDKGLLEDEFLTADSLIPLKKDAAERCLKQTLGEIEELIREKKWEHIVAVFHPVADKLPELLIHDQEVRIREKTALALEQLKRFDEAIGELHQCILKMWAIGDVPRNFGFILSQKLPSVLREYFSSSHC
jgi:hypothetical protein